MTWEGCIFDSMGYFGNHCGGLFYFLFFYLVGGVGVGGGVVVVVVVVVGHYNMVHILAKAVVGGDCLVGCRVEQQRQLMACMANDLISVTEADHE